MDPSEIKGSKIKYNVSGEVKQSVLRAKGNSSGMKTYFSSISSSVNLPALNQGSLRTEDNSLDS